jgi:alkanesulfonate monooxygenase SsuD/methylene tetrahydromethanopterin reductase-like flavin-dependent oxidoreductase (luciferase family)
MKFGLFYEISVPRPWTREAERTVYNNALEQVKLADSLGFEQVWAVEHHFLEEYSHCSAPELFLTACAMLTKQIRVGHGIIVCVPEFNHPIKIAERTATLDLLSGGRLDVGTGRSATWNELGGFRADPDITKKSWDEFVRCLPHMWTNERYSYEGEFWSMPERTILPKPYQQPHPPMWVAVTSPGTELDAADRGLGSLGLSFASFAEQEKKIATYRRRIQACEPVGLFVNEKVATTNFLFCHEDDAVGREKGQRLGNTFNYLAAQLISTREVYSSRSYQSLGLLPQLRRQATGPDAQGEMAEGLAFGDPARIIRAIKKWESIGVDQINFILNALEIIPQDEVMASLRLFGREVMPHFQGKTVVVAGAVADAGTKAKAKSKKAARPAAAAE